MFGKGFLTFKMYFFQAHSYLNITNKNYTDVYMFIKYA